MKILLDTNVILDVLLDRSPFADTSAGLISLIEQGKVTGAISASSVTTIYYLAEKTIGAQKARKALGNTLSLLEVAPVNRNVLTAALDIKMKDYEDAVIYQAAYHAGCQAIASRNVKDFKDIEIPVYPPLELIKIIALLESPA